VTKKLTELGILENTIIIFMSDNGPWYGGNTGGLKGMKATNREGGTRVPFIIRYPQQFPEGKTITVPCWSPDILPTLMTLTGIKTDPAESTNVLGNHPGVQKRLIRKYNRYLHSFGTRSSFSMVWDK